MAWDTRARRRASLAAGVVLLVAGAAALLLQRGSQLAASWAGWTSAVLVVGSVGASRAGRAVAVPIVMAWVGCLYAGVAGMLAAPGRPSSGPALGAAGAGALLAGLVASVGVARGRPLLLPPVAAGAVLLATGLVVQRLRWDPAVFLTSVLVAFVIAASWSPWLALGLSDPRAGPPIGAGSPAGDQPVDVDRLAGQARAAHQLLVGTTAAVGAVLVLAAAPAVSLGLAGTATAMLACLVVMLRTRHHRAGRLVLVGVGSGFAGLVATVSSILWLHPAWRHLTAVGLEGSGLVLVAFTLLPHVRAGPHGRLADLVESLGHVALVPTLVAATGLLSVIPR